MTLFDGVYIHPESYGTVLVIGAWNFPLLLTLAPVLPARIRRAGDAHAAPGTGAGVVDPPPALGRGAGDNPSFEHEPRICGSACAGTPPLHSEFREVVVQEGMPRGDGP